MVKLPAGVDPMTLVRRYEPALRFTAGELFFPMAVETYVASASLWAGSDTKATRIVEHGALDLDRLSLESRNRPDARLELRYVPGPLDRRQLKAWRRDPDRPRFRTSSRLAAVGLLGRVLDSLFRLSLILRGRVPRGITAAVHQAYRASGAANVHPYYARIGADGGYTVIQYWFFYPMNDWRSTFAGVNDHEGDWEQVTVYLAPDESDTGDGELRLAWVALSSHDIAGPDLRRRHDDPDLTWVDDTHVVVFVGAGSHSGAPMAGEYLVRFEIPYLRRLGKVLGDVREAVFPWTKGRPRAGIGIPYVDYKRGDGERIGPGGTRPWTPVLVDENTAWVRDYRGLWGLDTEDPFGGERAPAGPRYERGGAIRESWGDPVSWAGLDGVPATSAERARVRAERLIELEQQLGELDGEIVAEQDAVRRLTAGAAGSGSGSASAPSRRADGERQRALAELRAARRSAVAEHDVLRHSTGDLVAAPHAHLRRRVLPEDATSLTPGLLLKFWTGSSLSILLALFGLAMLFGVVSTPRVILSALLIVMFVEAVLRGRVLTFVLGLVTVAVVGVLAWLFVANWRYGLGGLAILGSVAVGIANVRALISRR